MKPLGHLTILDLSRVLACPFASMILAELGATVIKVEQPGSGDETRGFEPFVEKGGATESAYYIAFNRSKQSITVNLRSPEGQAIIRGLAQQADVLVENFPVGTLKRYGLDYAPVRGLNEKIIYVSCTGFGQSWPLRAPQGLRHRVPGDGRPHEPHRRARRRPGEAGAAGRRPDLGPVGGDRDPLRARRAFRDRPRQPHRFFDARRPGGAADARCGALFRAGRSAAAARHRASRPRSVGQLPLRRRRLAAHHRQRPALDAAVPGARHRILGSRAGTAVQLRSAWGAARK